MCEKENSIIVASWGESQGLLRMRKCHSLAILNEDGTSLRAGLFVPSLLRLYDVLALTVVG